VDIDGKICPVYILKRPGIEELLRHTATCYEIVIYTASLSKYADPLVEVLDPTHLSSYRLFREHCTFYNGVFVKDLSKLGRRLEDVIIVDVS
jgi:RNA polymerase II subunit A small phosphatase-like protein